MYVYCIFQEPNLHQHFMSSPFEIDDITGVQKWKNELDSDIL